MRKVHFYKAKSRLGIINPLPNTNDLDIGVENAPDAILTKDFLKNYSNKVYGSRIDEYVFPKPELIDKSRYFRILAKTLSEFGNLINKTLKLNETQVTIGGDNSVTFSSLWAVLGRAKDVDKVSYIQFDSHGELNLYKTSPSKNFHGMYTRPFLDTFDIPKIKSLINAKLDPANALFIGNLDLDKEERVYFEKTKLKNITRGMILQSKDKVIKELKIFISKFEYLHINFDIDVLSSREVLATGFPAENGFMFEEIEPLLRIISRHKKLSLDLCEVNPRKEGYRKTIKIAQKVLDAVLLK